MSLPGGTIVRCLGAQTWAVVASVLHTARQQGRDVLGTLKQLLMDCWAGKTPRLLTSS
jgi:hypothetical protein